MRTQIFSILALSASASALWAADVPTYPEANGLTPKSATFYVNLPGEGDVKLNNGKVESLGVAVANNGNVLIGWEDDGNELTDYEAVWTLFDGNGTQLTPDATINSSVEGVGSITSKYRAYFRKDGTPIPGNTAWGPKVKANLFGDGIGMGGTAFGIGLEIAELAGINVQDSTGGPGDFPAVQLIGNDGGPIAEALSGYSDEDADRPGDIRIGDWDYLSTGNIVIVGESRQQADLVDLFGGETPANHAAFRIVKPDGTVVKALTLASAEPVKSEMWHGVGVTKDGFAIRFAKGAAGRATIRLFKNDGTPASGDIDLGELAGSDLHATGGRGDGAGFHGNGYDAYVAVTKSRDPNPEVGVDTPYVMVINADGSLRYARQVADDAPKANTDRLDAAIAPDGRVIVAFDGNQFSTPRLVQARLFSKSGSPISSTFLVSESETPEVVVSDSRRPRVAWRNNQVAIVWESTSAPNVATRVVAGRIFTLSVGGAETAGLLAGSATTYVNPPGEGEVKLNNGKVESLGVAIASNGNVIVGWEDDGNELTDYEAAWTLYDRAGVQLSQDITINSSVEGAGSLNSKYRAYFRKDGSATPANTAWGPKIKANLFGPGIGMGGTAFSLGLEIPELADINVQESTGGAGDFPAVQLAKDDGSAAAEALSGYSEQDADRPGDIRIGDWDYLSNGNVVIVGESRQQADLVDLFGGEAGANHAAFRILKPDGTVVKPLTLVAEEPVKAEIWHGVGVTKDGFAVRFAKGAAGRATIRMFKNDGTPASGDIDLGTLAGSDVFATGGRGDGVGFHGNGNDAYVVVTKAKDPDPEVAVDTPYLMVINADGTLRYTRKVADDFPKANTSRLDAAITPDGRVVVAFDGNQFSSFRLVQARLFNRDGSPLSPTFLVSELETPALAVSESRQPRVAWRDNQIAIVWESTNIPEVLSRVVALRVLNLPSTEPSSTTIGFALSGNNLTLTWEGSGTLQSAADPAGPWEAVAGAASPAVVKTDEAHRYYRVR